MKATKYALIVMAALALVGAAGLTYLALTFDPLDYAPRLIAVVKDKTGRTLDIKGRIELSFWPRLNLAIGAMSLSERSSEALFAEIEGARLNVRLLPLLSRQLVVDQAVIAGAHVRVTRFADGRLNIDDLIGSEGGALTFDIGRIRVEHSALTYNDVAKGHAYEFSAIEFESDRVSSAHNTPLTLAFRARHWATTSDVAVQLKGRYTFDAGNARYALHETTLHLTGTALGLTQLAVQAQGDFAVTGQGRDAHLAKASVTLKGVWKGAIVEAGLAGDALAIVAGKVGVDALRADVRWRSNAGTAKLDLAVPRLQYAGQTWTGTDANMAVDLERSGRVMHASIAAPLEIDPIRRTWRLPQMQTRFSVRGAGLPDAGVTGALSGHAEVDLSKQHIQSRVAGRIGASEIKAVLTSTGFAIPAYTFAVELDQLDLDGYIGTDKVPTSGSDTINLDAIAELPATGTLKIGLLKTSGVRANNVKLVIKP